MQGWGKDFRAWLLSLDEPGARALLTWHQCLRDHAGGPRHETRSSSPVTRRELNTLRVWVTRAKQPQLDSAARCGLTWACRALIDNLGCPPDVIRQPTLEQLRTMLEVLDPALARCALYGLLAGDLSKLPAVGMARKHENILWPAVDSLPPSDPAETLRSVVTAVGRRGPGAPVDAVGRASGEDVRPDAHEEEHLANASSEGSDGPHHELAELKQAGARLTTLLRAAADAVENGRRPVATGEVVDALTGWAMLRERIADRCADMGVDWPDESDYAWLAAEQLRLEKARAELASLRERADSYDTLIGATVDPDETATLSMLRDRVHAQIDELTTALGKDAYSAATVIDDRASVTEPSGEDPYSATEGAIPADDDTTGRVPDAEVLPGAGRADGVTAPRRGDAPTPDQSETPLVEERPQQEASPEAQPSAATPEERGEAELAENGTAQAEMLPAAADADAQVASAPLAVDTEPRDTSLNLPTATDTDDRAQDGGFDGQDKDVTGARDTVAADTAQEQPQEPRTSHSSTSDTSSEDEPWPAAVVGADWDVRAPWDSGQEPPVARLVAVGRLAEAYWMTAASAEPDIRARALAFTAAAFGCVTESEATDVQILHDLDPARLAQDRDAHLTALVAALRAGLTACWPHALVSDFTAPAGLAAPWQELLTVLVTAVRNGRSFEPGAQHADDDSQEHDLREELGSQAQQLLDGLSRRKTKYQRATRVLQYLVGPMGELGVALGDVIQWVTGGELPATGLRSRAEELRDHDYVDRLIEQTDSRFRTPKQAKEPITAGALRQLHAACRSVSDVLMKADAVAASLMRPTGLGQSGIPDLAAARRDLRQVAPPPGVGGAALLLLQHWLEGIAPPLPAPEGRPDGDGGSATPSADCLLALPELPRDDSGLPDLHDTRTARRMAALMADPDAEQALRRYLTRGDLHLARALVDSVRQDVSACGVVDADWAENAERRLQQGQENWRATVRRRHTKAAGLLAQMRTLNLLAPDQERQFTGRLQEFAHGEDLGRYRYAVARLDELGHELSQLVQRSTRRQLQELEQLRLAPGRPLGQAEYDRIAKLITEGDTVTAEEFLALARGGRPLPERPDDDDAELADFMEDLTGPGVPQPGGDGVDADWWAHAYGPNGQLTEAAELGLKSWKALCTRHGRNSEWQQHLPRVLRLLGLEPHTQPVVETRTQGVRRFKVRARVAERTGYVAALGSQATSYTIQLIWEEQRANGPLAHLEDADVDANLVLYLHPLGSDGRRRLADASRSGAQQALVVDPAVVGWMAARAPGSFRAMQRVTLPWTAYNPYTPFVAGLVPAEVFYGRDEEMREVMDPRGGLFLYGGRQLGKSALLRRVAKIFPRHSDDYVAVYLDLLKSEIGQAEAPDKIWSMLADELKRRGVFGNRRVEQAGPDLIARRLGEWLDEDESRRLLVLADEADAFLTADSRRTFKVGGESTFPNVKRFQQLMEHSDRRFKIVFAGLHQVQRFGALSNVSTAHGGPDVLVGPLKQQAALKLVTEPMAALGYVFERPELVWRILAITNYQANLVQIFCSELVRTLHSRPYVVTGRAMAITDGDVQEVAASETLRRRIAERLRFTINLEDRYRVLALVIALRSLEDGYRGGYSAKELLDLARDAWPAGFEECGVQQAEIYLTEMVGLGLLIRLGDRAVFAVRSPNVVNMLGTREELELELHETEFGLPYDYNPRAARRVLGRDRSTGVQRYSPLTEGQLHEAAQPGVSVVPTTELHQPELVLRAVAAFAEGRGVRVVRADRADVQPALADAVSRPRTAHVVLVDLRGVPVDDLGEQLRVAVEHAGPPADKHVPQSEGRKEKQTRSVLVVADAEAVGALRAADEGRRLRVRLLKPLRWTADSLRAWPECPFVSGEDRRRLTAATSGWPRWMETAVADVSLRGATLDDALEHIRTVTTKPTNVEEHLRLSGFTGQDLALLEMWTAYVEEGQGVPVDDVEAATGLSARETADWLAHLDRLGVLDEVDGGLAVDPVTFRALRARATGAT